MIQTVMQSENRKLVGDPKTTFNWSPRPVAATMRAVGATCPNTCQFLPEKLGGRKGAGGCYAAGGPVHWRSKGALPEDTDGGDYLLFTKTLPKGWPVRLHVAGDFFKDSAVDAAYTEMVLRAHRERPDLQAWTYTHDFRAMREAGYGADVMNAAGGLVVNASCDTLFDAHEAAWEGWPVVVTVHSGEKRRRWTEGELDIVMCPNQSMADGNGVGGVACNTCLLCAKPRSFAIAFRHHGTGTKKADARVEALEQLPLASD